MTRARQGERVQPETGERSMTKQSFVDACNPNTIVAQYKRSGVVNHITQGEGVYGDFDQFESLQGALIQVESMWKEFDALGAKVRDEADNDPLIFAQMLGDEEGSERLVCAGLFITDPETGEIREPKVPEDQERTVRATPEEVVSEEKTGTN